ncbi:MAG: hypothetical protein CL521_00285 [Actinobacteria bacterium]|nr:hypothetical protein [Actinomycetota bacterium]
MYVFLNQLKAMHGNFTKGEDDIFLYHYERRHSSQHGEDGVLEKIFEVIGTTNKYYVEFGVEDGRECNVRYLKEHHGFQGLLMDGGYENKDINLQKAFITAENINSLFEDYHVPMAFDLLSIDIDYNDFWVFQALSSSYQPRVLVLEINASISPDLDQTVPYDPKQSWDGTRYYGASLLAMTRLARSKGYELVYMESSGTNAFFIQQEILSALKLRFYKQGDIRSLYRYPAYGPRLISGKIGPVLCKGHPKGPLKRPFVSSGL